MRLPSGVTLDALGTGLVRKQLLDAPGLAALLNLRLGVNRILVGHRGFLKTARGSTKRSPGLQLAHAAANVTLYISSSADSFFRCAYLQT